MVHYETMILFSVLCRVLTRELRLGKKVVDCIAVSFVRSFWVVFFSFFLLFSLEFFTCGILNLFTSS